MIPLQLAPFSYALIVVTVLATIWQFRAPAAFTQRFMLSTEGVFEKRQFDRLLTHGFLHGGGAHLLFNMITLFFFGPAVEAYFNAVVDVGPLGFPTLYFGSLFISAAVSIWAHRRNRSYSAVGASGAVSGVVFALILFAPQTSLYLFFIPIPIPAYVFGPAYLLYSAVAMGGTSRIGHEAHIAGALAGLGLTLLMAPEALGMFLVALGLA